MRIEVTPVCACGLKGQRGEGSVLGKKEKKKGKRGEKLGPFIVGK